MSHSTQCECVGCHMKLETEQEDVLQPRGHSCFFDDHPAEVFLQHFHLYLCATHAICSACLSPLTQDAVICRCEKYGYSGHEELLWCSEQCMEHAHPEPDWDHHEVDEAAEEAQG